MQAFFAPVHKIITHEVTPIQDLTSLDPHFISQAGQLILSIYAATNDQHTRNRGLLEQSRRFHALRALLRAAACAKRESCGP